MFYRVNELQIKAQEILFILKILPERFFRNYNQVYVPFSTKQFQYNPTTYNSDIIDITVQNSIFRLHKNSRNS